MKLLIVPGTTVSIALLPGYVELRDRGIIKKKIPTGNRSFDEVLGDVNSYFRYRGKILAPGMIRDTLVKIGLPQVKLIVSEEEKEGASAEEPVEEVLPAPKEEPPAPSESTSLPGKIIEVVKRRVSSKPKDIVEIAEEEELQPKEEKTRTVISGIEIKDVEQALTAVETLSDSFMTPSKSEEKVEA